MNVSIEDLEFRHGRAGFRLAIPELSFSSGRVAALVGPNGAGKTTLLHLVAGLLQPLAGQVLVGGRCADRVLPTGTIGFCPDAFPPSGRQRLVAWLRWMIELRRGRRIDPGETEALAGTLGAEDLLPARLDRLSRGQAKRAGLLLAMAGEPSVLLLDEPTAYLDPEAVRLLRERLLELRERGVTIVVSSHHLGELEKVADDVVFLSQGRVVRRGAVRDSTDRRCELVVSAWPDAARRRWKDADWESRGDGRVLVRVRCSGREELARVEGFLLGAGEQVFEIRGPSDFLEEWYRECIDA